MSDTILEELRTHLFIEFFYSHSNKGLIAEQTYTHKDTKYLFERYGVTDGLDEFAKDIEYGLLHGHYLFASRGHYGIDFPIDTVEFRIDKFLDKRMAYIPKFTVLKQRENGTSYIDFMLVDIAPNLTIDDNLVPLIVHELTHGIEDKGLNRSGKSLSGELEKSGYFDYGKQNTIGLDRMLNELLYYFNYYEQNSYVAQMATELRTYKGEFKTINEILTFLRNTWVYKTYEKMFKIADDLTHDIPETSKKILLHKINSMSKYNFKTYGEFTDFLKYRLKNIKRKFNNVIPKIAYQNVNMIRYEVISRPMGEEMDWGNVNVLDLIREYEERVQRIWAD